MRFSDDFINRVRDSSNIVEIISQHTDLKRAGHNLMGLCPFPDHREKTPSFSVSEDKQAYYCFGCKRGGNVYRFLEQVRGMSFPEAIEYLAERASIALPKEAYEGSHSQDQREQKKLLYKINKFAGYFFRQTLVSLPPEHPVVRYMEQRGLSSQLAEEFKIGLAPSEWSGLANFLASKKAPLDQAERLGLIRRRTGGQSGYYDLFRDRLMFPILSPTEEVVGFGGRILGDGQPKYLNSPESPLFHKGSTLYGLHATAKHIRVQDQVIVVEGYMDLLGLYGSGIQNVVATLGTALTPEHAKLLSRYTKNIIVLFDGDSAGQEAADRSLPILLAEGLLPRGLTLADNLDPDEAVQKFGTETFTKMLAEAQDLFMLYLNKLLVSYRGLPTEKVQVLEQVGPVLLSTRDAKLKDLYLDYLRDRLGVEDRWLRLALADLAKKIEAKNSAAQARSASYQTQNVAENNAPQALTEQRPKLKVHSPQKDEVLLLNLVLAKEEILKQVREANAIQFLGQSELREIFEIIEQVYGQGPSEFARLTALLSDRLQDPSLVTQHLRKDFEEMVEAKGAELVKDCLDRLKDRHLRNEARRLAEELKIQQDPKKLEQFMNIQRELHSLK